jgi:hypothetical protein
METVTPDEQAKFYHCVERIIQLIYDMAYRDNSLSFDAIEKGIVRELTVGFNDRKISEIIGRSTRTLRNKKNGPRRVRQNNRDM